GPASVCAVKVTEPRLGERHLYCEGAVPLLFTENETNTQRIFSVPNRTPYVKDGINNYIVHGQTGAVNPEKKGTKVSAHYHVTVNPGEAKVIRLRLGDVATNSPFGKSFEDAFKARRKEADEFYATVIPGKLNDDQKNVMRQALAGMMWSK